MSIGARSPVIVGVSQVANKDPGRLVHPVALMAEAARAACADAHADVLPWIGSVHSAPMSIFGDEHGGEMVAGDLGLTAGERIQWKYSGAAPQSHLAEACAQIMRGEVDAVLLVGGIADASFRNAGRQGIAPPAPPTSVWSQGSGGVGDLTPNFRHHWVVAEGDAGAEMPSSFFALVESAIGAAQGLGPAEHRAYLGNLLAEFTEVAARRPDVAWFPTARTAEELATPAPANRFIAEPYTKLMCSFPTVDLAAAVIVASTGLADRLGVPTESRVHPWVGVGAREAGAPSTRPQIHEARALTSAAQRALELAGITGADVGAFDFYSCFPAAIQLGMAAFGLGADDPRQRTVTGGLPFFGGPGANYTLHGIVSLVEHCRSHPETVGAMVGLGGMIDDFAVGLYSTAAPASPFRGETLDPGATGAVETVRTAAGRGVVLAATVLHDRDRGPVAAPAIVQLDDGRRVGARAADPGAPAHLSGGSIVGKTVTLVDNDGTCTYEM